MDEFIKMKTEDQCNDVYYKLACALDPQTASFVARDEGNIEKLTQAAYVANGERWPWTLEIVDAWLHCPFVYPNQWNMQGL